MKNLITTCLALLFFAVANAQWYQVNDETMVETLYDIAFVDENIGFAVGGYNQSTTNPAGNGIILKTTDGGESWTTIYNDPDIVRFSEIVVLDGQVIVFGGASGVSKLYVSNDNGESWEITSLGYTPVDVRTSSNIIYFRHYSGSTALYKMEDGEVSTVVEDVGRYGVNDNELVYVENTYNTIFKSTDYGSSFEALTGYPEDFSQNQSTNAVIRSFGDTIIVHYTYPPYTVYSLDNGETWTYVYSSSDYSEIISENLLMGSAYNQLYSQTNFEPWEEVTTVSDEIKKIYIYNEVLGFLVGENGMIYKTTSVEGLSVGGYQAEEQLIEIIPNPATEQIQIENIDKLNISSIELFDVSGKKVKVFNADKASLDVSNLSKGMYLLKISTPTATLTKKIIKK